MLRFLSSQGALLLCSLILFVSCGNNKTEKRSERTAVRVKTMAVAAEGVEENRSFSGTVEEDSGTAVSFATAGTIKTLNISEGDRVTKGQIIGTLDDGSLRNAYEIALSTVKQAKDAYSRMKMLHDANSLPDIKWVEVESKLHQAESAADIARIALEDAKLRSPVSGVVSEKIASVGQTVAPGMPIAKIVDIKKVKVCISVPENEISNYKTGATATISTSASANETFQGTLVDKGIIANPLSRTYIVKFQVDNSAAKLLPGMICNVVLNQGSSVSGVILPVSAVLLSAENTNFVWLDSAGVARKRYVVTGEMLPEGVVIVSGLNNGDKVITAGTEKVSQNTKVKSIN